MRLDNRAFITAFTAACAADPTNPARALVTAFNAQMPPVPRDETGLRALTIGPTPWHEGQDLPGGAALWYDLAPYWVGSAVCSPWSHGGWAGLWEIALLYRARARSITPENETTVPNTLMNITSARGGRARWQDLAVDDVVAGLTFDQVEACMADLSDLLYAVCPDDRPIRMRAGQEYVFTTLEPEESGVLPPVPPEAFMLYLRAPSDKALASGLVIPRSRKVAPHESGDQQFRNP